MSNSRAATLLNRFPDLRLAVLGDFFVDQYLLIDPALAETSLETGLEAHQVTELRAQPGAAGTITCNLAALEVGTIRAVGFRGVDGLGFELERGLQATGVITDDLFATTLRATPAYTKPLVIEPGSPPRELNRLDLKNRTPTPPEVEDEIIERLRAVAGEVDAILALDQVDKPDHGVITGRVRQVLTKLGRERLVVADSRRRIGAFQGVILKSNIHEITAALAAEAPELAQAAPHELARRWSRRQGCPAFITLGPDGALCVDREVVQVPGIRVDGPLDIVGAGDSFSAAATAALAAGGTMVDAARLGCATASLTIQQLGTTGTATRAEVRAVLANQAADAG